MGMSLSSDVECTMTADSFTQMRGLITLQRMFVNEAALAGVEGFPPLMQCADAIRHATIEGARGLGLDGRTGSLTPGKEADIVLLDARAINVAPLNNVPGAVVTLMDRSNVDSVFVAPVGPGSGGRTHRLRRRPSALRAGSEPGLPVRNGRSRKVPLWCMIAPWPREQNQRPALG